MKSFFSKNRIKYLSGETSRYPFLTSFFSYQKQDAVSDVYENYAYLNPFKEKPAALYTPRTPKIEVKENTTKPVVTTTKIEPITAAILVDESKETQLKL